LDKNSDFIYEGNEKKENSQEIFYGNQNLEKPQKKRRKGAGRRT